MDHSKNRCGCGILTGTVFLCFLLVCASCAHSRKIDTAKAAKGTKVYEHNWESLKEIPVPQWFDDAKFGIFIHWGGYSVIGYKKGGRGYAEHSPKYIYRESEYYYPYLKERFGACPPEFGYKDILTLFKAEKWNPDEWAELFKNAGARYVILTGEHHDGFALWDSDLTDWCVTKVGPMRDLVGDLGKAVRAKGMKFAPSYHRERHTGFFAKNLYAVHSEPKPDIAEEIKRDPKAALLYGPFDYDDAFIKSYVDRWKEMQDKYQPDFMWIDDVPIFYKAPNDPQVVKFKEACMDMIADYMNAATKWDKEVYLNNKGKHLNWPEGIGCREKDNLKMDAIGPKWENPATLGTSYGYMKFEEEKDQYKSPKELIHLLVDVVSKNGNLLLNIGPRPDGTIPEGMQRRLLAIGNWLQTNGQAIYGTAPWTKFEQKEGNLRFTTKGDVLYAIALDKPAGSFVVEMSTDEAARVTFVELLGSKAKVKWAVIEKGLSITSPEKIEGDYAWTFKIKRKDGNSKSSVE